MMYSTSYMCSKQHTERTGIDLPGSGCCSAEPGRLPHTKKNRTVPLRGPNSQQDGSSEEEGSLPAGVMPKDSWEVTSFGQLSRILITRQ